MMPKLRHGVLAVDLPDTKQNGSANYKDLAANMTALEEDKDENKNKDLD